MSDAANALGALGSDLAFSVSFGIARELLDAANESGVSEDELVAVVIALSVVFAALPKSVRLLREELREHGWLGFSKANKDDGNSGVLDFLSVLVDIAKRISVSISVQLLASNVRARQTLRAVRVVSLLSISVFFLFLEATSSVGVKPRRT